MTRIKKRLGARKVVDGKTYECRREVVTEHGRVVGTLVIRGKQQYAWYLVEDNDFWYNTKDN